MAARGALPRLSTASDGFAGIAVAARRGLCAGGRIVDPCSSQKTIEPAPPEVSWRPSRFSSFGTRWMPAKGLRGLCPAIQDAPLDTPPKEGGYSG
jgi:hypothetical protein